MANYALTLKVLGPDTLKNIGTAIHDYLETIDSTKVIHLKERADSPTMARSISDTIEFPKGP